jgi:hypothetical protein
MNGFDRGALAMFIFALGAPAAWSADQPVSDPVSARMALNGYWRPPHGTPPPQGGGGGPMAPVAAKLQPWAATERAKSQAAEAAGEFVATPDSNCMPSAVPGTGVPGGSAYAIEILVEPKQVTFLYEENRMMRFVYIDETHPVGPAAGWLGDSSGHWEGDTLVIDTVGFNDKNIVARGIPMSAKMHIVQRLRVVDGVLEDRATFDDPGAFTGPFELTNRFERGVPFQEYVCQENNQEGGFPTSTGERTDSQVSKRPAR